MKKTTAKAFMNQTQALVGSLRCPPHFLVFFSRGPELPVLLYVGSAGIGPSCMKQDGGPAPKHPGSTGAQPEFRGHPGMGLDMSRGDETGSAPMVPAPASKANFHFPVAQE